MKAKQTYLRRLTFERFEQRLLLTAVLRPSPRDAESLLRLDVAPREDVGDRLANGVSDVFMNESSDRMQPTEAHVKIRLDLTDSHGLPVTTVEPGDRFTLNVYVTDQRQDALGVYSAYLDVHFDAALAELDGALVFDGPFTNVVAGESARGLLDEVGATFAFPTKMGRSASSFLGTMGNESLLFHAPFRAIGSGAVTFRADAADVLPYSDVLILGVNQPIGPQQIQFGSASVDVIERTSFAKNAGEPAGFGNPTLGFPSITSTSAAPKPQTAGLFPPELYPREATTATASRGPSVNLPAAGKPIDPRTAFGRRDPSTLELEPNGPRQRDSRPVRPSGDFIELEIVPLNRLHGSREPTSQGPDPTPDGTLAPSSPTDALKTSVTGLQGWFDRDFQRISWEGVKGTSLNLDWIDITEVAYRPLRATGRFGEHDTLPLRRLVDDDSSDCPSEAAEDDACLDAIDTLFALGVELKAADSWELAMEFASDDDEGEGGEVVDEEAAAAEEGDAGPPQPGRSERRSNHSAAPSA